MPDAAEANGEHATKVEHETLRKYVERRFDEQDRQLDFIAEQVKLIGQAMEALLKASGVDDDD